MTQSNFEKNGGTYTQIGDYLIPRFYITARRAEHSTGYMGHAAQTLPYGKSAGYIQYFADERNTLETPCRH